MRIFRSDFCKLYIYQNACVRIPEVYIKVRDKYSVNSSILFCQFWQSDELILTEKEKDDWRPKIIPIQ